jgi:hypothetical protein
MVDIALEMKENAVGRHCTLYLILLHLNRNVLGKEEGK